MKNSRIKLLSCIMFYCLMCVVYQVNAQEKIQVSVSQKDQIKLSEIADDVEVLKLEKGNSAKPYKIERVALSKEYIFVTESSDNDENVATKVLQFSRQGKFIREVVTFEHTPGKWKLGAIVCSEANKMLYIVCMNRIMCYDFNGALIKEIKDIFPLNLYCKWDQLFVCEWKSKGDKNVLNVYSFDKQFNRTKVTSIDLDMPMIHRIPFSSVGDLLYFGTGFGNAILGYDGEKLTKEYLFEFSRSPRSNFDKMLSNQMRIGDIVFCSYRRGSFYQCIKNLKTGELYNLLIDTSEKVTGITDDFYNTGYVRLRNTTGDNQMVFIKEASDVVGKIEGVKSDSNPIIFLTTLKH